MEKQGLRFKSFVHAWMGIRLALQTQVNLRFHAVATGLVVIAGLVLGVSAVEWCLLFLAIGLVWVSEMVNTAMEWLVDLASPGYHELAKRAKDSAAGAVLFAALISVLTGIIVFLPRFLSWLPS